MTKNTVIASAAKQSRAAPTGLLRFARNDAGLVVSITILLATLLTGNTITIPPKAERGKAGAACRTNEGGPAVRVTLVGVKDSKGALKLELYPANDADFLAPDKELIAAGKPFKRIETKANKAGDVELCIRAPRPGRYGLSVLHDRDGNGKFSLASDGVGFSNNPKLKRAKPKAASVAIEVGPGVSQTRIVMNYLRGLGFGPVKGG